MTDPAKVLEKALSRQGTAGSNVTLQCLGIAF